MNDRGPKGNSRGRLSLSDVTWEGNILLGPPARGRDSSDRVVSRSQEVCELCGTRTDHAQQRWPHEPRSNSTRSEPLGPVGLGLGDCGSRAACSRQPDHPALPGAETASRLEEGAGFRSAKAGTDGLPDASDRRGLERGSADEQGRAPGHACGHDYLPRLIGPARSDERS